MEAQSGCLMFEGAATLPPEGTQNTTSGILPVRFDAVWYQQQDKTLLRNLTFDLRPGTKTVIMGPNGAGKSLLLRLLQGLIEPTRGRITWSRPAHALNAAPPTALVLQRPVLLRRSVEANLIHALRTFRVSKPLRAQRVDDLLAMCSLTNQRRQPARSLSGGEQQRLAVVRALAGEPELLLLDEPTANLDPQATDAIETLVSQAQTQGTKIVLVTHDIGQARRMADEVIFMADGKIAEIIDADTFFTAPVSTEAKLYLSGQLLL